MERAATAPEPQATLATAPHLGRPMPPEAARQKALSKPIQPIQTTPAQARGVASTGTEQVAPMALRSMQGVFETPSNSGKPSHPKSTSCGRAAQLPSPWWKPLPSVHPTWEGTSQPSISYGEQLVPLFFNMLTHFSFSPHSCGPQEPTTQCPALGTPSTLDSLSYSPFPLEPTQTARTPPPSVQSTKNFHSRHMLIHFPFSPHACGPQVPTTQCPALGPLSTLDSLSHSPFTPQPTQTARIPSPSVSSTKNFNSNSRPMLIHLHLSFSHHSCGPQAPTTQSPLGPLPIPESLSHSLFQLRTTQEARSTTPLALFFKHQ
mmetsp:Transcript_28212/g.86206  ORF Transcript_28212/g.86206 Transcript_28212/m.86206 type:complete len:318 (-) Transcript_28212:7-960(-)